MPENKVLNQNILDDRFLVDFSIITGRIIWTELGETIHGNDSAKQKRTVETLCSCH